MASELNFFLVLVIRQNHLALYLKLKHTEMSRFLYYKEMQHN